MVIGTVKGDIHDIGKNLVAAMMMEGAGFEVDGPWHQQPGRKNIWKRWKTHKPDILGMSALLTTTMPYMKVVIDTMKEKGIRDDYVVLVGGCAAQRGIRQGRRCRCLLRDAAVAVETARNMSSAATTRGLEQLPDIQRTSM